MATTATKTKPRAEEDVSVAMIEEATGGPVAKFNTVRLPYHDAFSSRFGVDRGAWKVLVEAIWPTATSVDSVAMALAYCKARNLDPFKRVVHIVPMWNSVQKKLVETVWPGIAEIRTTAFRTGQYAGCDEAAFGPIIESTLGGVRVLHPEWCRLTVYRELSGRVCRFVGPKVMWLETYATKKHDTDAPNEMWATRSEGQIEKCAEAAALRRAFPEELGNVYAAEEMEGKMAHGDIQGVPVERPASPTPPPAPTMLVKPPPAPPPIIEMQAAPPHDSETGEIADDDAPALLPEKESEALRIGLIKRMPNDSTASLEKWIKERATSIATLQPDDRQLIQDEWSARQADLFEREQREEHITDAG